IVAPITHSSQFRDEVLVGGFVLVSEGVDLRHEVVVRLQAVLEELLASFLACEHLCCVHLGTIGHESPRERPGGHLHHQVEPA
ncbi:hypothetical protein PMAYCL1PPCAC_28917, partial [Pristionchus mayeri]